MSVHRRISHRLLLATAVGLALVAGSVTPALAGPTSAPAPARVGFPATSGAATWAGTDFVALGDSYSAGVGAPADADGGDCRRSNESYPALWAAEHGPRSFTFVACSGATTGDVLADQVSAVTADTDLVNITVGGNDVGFSPVVAGCTAASTDAACLALVESAEQTARTVLPAALVQVYGTIRYRARHARVIVLGYPYLFEAGDCDNPLVPNAVRREALNEAADVLNRSIRRSARLLGATYVDVRKDFSGHGVCGAESWLVAPASMPPAADVYHPTEEGYRSGYLGALDRTPVRRRH
jgi:lysophospholipase L1-like esterase